MRFALILTATLFGIVAAQAEPHPCGADAVARAGKLLKTHWESEGSLLAENPGPPDENSGDRMAWSIDETAQKVATIKALAGKGRFDVVEVNAGVYKAEYRLQFYYAQIPDTCILMGQEIIEIADPY
jgi:hypothetical protein